MGVEDASDAFISYWSGNNELQEDFSNLSLSIVPADGLYLVGLGHLQADWWAGLDPIYRGSGGGIKIKIPW